jgi:hypothetical protein
MPVESTTAEEKTSASQSQAAKAAANRKPRGTVSSYGSRVDKHGSKRRGAQETAVSHLGEQFACSIALHTKE